MNIKDKIKHMRKWAKDCREASKSDKPVTTIEMVAFKMSMITPHTQQSLEPLIDQLLNALSNGAEPALLMAAIGVATSKLPLKNKDMN